MSSEGPPTTDYTAIAGSPLLTSLTLPLSGAPSPDAYSIARVTGADLATDAPLVDVVLIALASDRRARASDDVPAGASRRGWWASGPDGFGSRLWLLAGAKLTPATLRTAEDYASEALAFIVAAGIASAVTPSAVRLASGTLGLVISIARPDLPDLVVRYDSLWSTVNG